MNEGLDPLDLRLSIQMGNSFGSPPSDPSGVAGKVVLSDGRVQECEETTTVAELMLEHPQHVVVEFDPSAISCDDRHRNNTKIVKKKLTPLPADKTLEPGKIYLMLPAKRAGAKRGSSTATLTSEEVRRMLLSATAMLRSTGSYYEGIIPWLARVCPTGGRKPVVVAAEKTAAPAATRAGAGQLEGAEEQEDGVRPEYLSRQLSGKGWKPSLDTIKEKNVKKKINHWLFF